MKIRDEQMEALAAAMESPFYERTIRFLREHWADECAGREDDDLKRTIARALRRVRGYGLDSEQDAVRYLNLMFRLGSEFESDPRYAWVSELLADTQIPAEHKLELATARVIAQLKGHP